VGRAPAIVAVGESREFAERFYELEYLTFVYPQKSFGIAHFQHFQPLSLYRNPKICLDCLAIATLSGGQDGN